jgi:hypothetical protein
MKKQVVKQNNPEGRVKRIKEKRIKRGRDVTLRMQLFKAILTTAAVIPDDG